MESRLNSIQKEMTQPIELRNFSNYKQPSRPKAFWQIANTVGPYLVLWALMIFLLRQAYPYWTILLLSVPAAGLLVRIFILFHDCCHRSFFASRLANLVLGYLFGILAFTPYEEWRSLHLKHHGTAGNLDKRGMGDIWTLTVQEYLESSVWKRIQYRIVRNPTVMLGLGPFFYFLLVQRFWNSKATRKQKVSVMLTNFFLLLIIGGSSLTIGLVTYLMIQIPIILLAGSIGIWLFYIQHQFEGVYWARQKDWNPTKAALEGSSFYKLPRLLQWVSGNIGFHHIHHIRPQIPNYNLERCYREIPEFQSARLITLRKSLSSLFLNLWHEQHSKLISFRNLKKIQAAGNRKNLTGVF